MKETPEKVAQASAAFGVPGNVTKNCIQEAWNEDSPGRVKTTEGCGRPVLSRPRCGRQFFQKLHEVNAYMSQESCPVAQAFQPAVSPTFQSAARTGTRRARRLENLRYGRLESLRYEPGYE